MALDCHGSPLGDAGGHPRRFRHTFSVDLLSKGVDIKPLPVTARPLECVLITENFYCACIAARQQILSEEITSAWRDDLSGSAYRMEAQNPRTALPSSRVDEENTISPSRLNAANLLCLRMLLFDSRSKDTT